MAHSTRRSAISSTLTRSPKHSTTGCSPSAGISVSWLNTSPPSVSYSSSTGSSISSASAMVSSSAAPDTRQRFSPSGVISGSSLGSNSS